MKLINKTFKATLALSLFLAGCGDFGDMNVDPNNPSDAKNDLLLTSSLTSVSTVVGATTPAMYVQYFAETQYTDESRYFTEQFDFNGWYTGPMINLQTIIDSPSSTDNYKGVARIMKAYFMQFVTDRWGMVPYSEALKGADNFSPAYDSQQDIYHDIINEYKAGANLLSTANGIITGDILLGGDLDEWKKFANTLRMNAALRLSDAEAAYAQTEFAAAYADGIITSDVFYTHLAEDANASPWYTRYITRTDYAISDTVEAVMKNTNDLRLTAYADPAANLDNDDGVTTMAEIAGMPYGVVGSIAGSIENDDVSYPGSAIRSQDSPLSVITVAQAQLSVAEGRQRGWIAGSAQAAYDAAIDASWAQWGISDAGALAAYKALPSIAYSSATTAEWKSKIGYQKWLAAYPNGYEAWAEWRRLDYPQLLPAASPLNNSGNIPVRHAYPQSESQINKVNYDAAVAIQGADVLDTKVWWDKN